MRSTLALLLVALAALAARPDAGADEGAVLPRARVVLVGRGGVRHPVDVEVAATRAARARGLMGRDALPEGQGMLFVFTTDARHGFWMRDTRVALDMLFLAADGAVVGVIERAEPGSLSTRQVARPSRYVLEVPGGWARAHGAGPGARAELPPLDGVPVEP